jgi:hypothetical protein
MALRLGRAHGNIIRGDQCVDFLYSMAAIYAGVSRLDRILNQNKPQIAKGAYSLIPFLHHLKSIFRKEITGGANDYRGRIF